MPRTISDTTPSRLRLRVLHTLLTSPATYNCGTLADHLGERYQRVVDAVSDIDAEFTLEREGQNQLLTVILPGPVRMLTPDEVRVATVLDALEG